MNGWNAVNSLGTPAIHQALCLLVKPPPTAAREVHSGIGERLRLREVK